MKQINILGVIVAQKDDQPKLSFEAYCDEFIQLCLSFDWEKLKASAVAEGNSESPCDGPGRRNAIVQT